MAIRTYINYGRYHARNTIPDTLRKPIGALCGRFFQCFVRPLLGLLFDVFQVRYRTDGCEFEIPRDQTSRNFRACFFIDDYENEERALIARNVKKDDSVLEYGACIGVVSCTTNKLLSKCSKHVVVEGNPLLISTIAKNSVINDCSFTVYNGLASKKNVFLPFYIHPEFIVGVALRKVGDIRFLVEGLPLETAIDRFGRFDVLVVDVEGAELELFEEGIKELHLFRLIIVELHRFAYGSEGEEQCRELLANAGFQRVEVEGDTEAWLRK